MIDTQIDDVTNANGDPRGVKGTLFTTIDSSPRKLFKKHRKLTSAFASLRVHLNSIRYCTGKQGFTVQHSMNEKVKCAGRRSILSLDLSLSVSLCLWTVNFTSVSRISFSSLRWEQTTGVY